MAQNLSKIKENHEHPFVDLGELEKCANFYQKLLNSMVVGAHQSF